MTTTTNLKYRNIPVEVLDVFESGGIELAVIEAIEGKPFADGAKTTTKTAFLTVNFDDLEECGCVLPEQSCPVCRRAARRVYGNEDEWD